MIKNIFILVGGRGSRLGKLTLKTPKPLLKFNNKPFLDYILEKLLVLNPKKIYLLCHYKKEFFAKYHKQKIQNTTIHCINESKPLGTGGSLFNSKEKIENQSLMCNGDTLINFNFKKIKNIKLGKNIICLFCISNKNYKSNKKLGNIDVKNNKINFKKKTNLMNAGIYIFDKRIKKYLSKSIFSFEEEVIVNLIQKKRVIGKKINAKSIDIGIKKNYKLLKKELSKYFNYPIR